MVGRNDPCPCGSGKKYKKCCGGEETVDLQQVIDQELDAVMMGFVDQGLTPKEFHQMTQRFDKWQSVLSNIFDTDMIEAIAFESYVFHDRVDIWKDWIARQKKTKKRQRVLDVLELWEEPFYMLVEVQDIENGMLQLRDKVTGDIHHMANTGGAKKGEWLFGVFLRTLRDGKPAMQPAEGLITIPDFQRTLHGELAARLKAGVSDPLDLYRPFAESVPELELTPFQQEVMGLIAGFIDDYGLSNETIEGIAFTFLMEGAVKARKPEGVAAGILQAASDFGLFEEVHVTQQMIAEELGTSVGILSKYRDMVGEFVIERMERDKNIQAHEQQPALTPAVITDIGTDPRMTERGLWEMLMRTKNAKSRVLFRSG